MRRLRLHPENHLIGRIGWLRAAVLAAEAATEAAEQEDDEDDDKYEADRHDLSPVTTPSQTFVASSYSDCEAPVSHFPDDALSREPSRTELVLLDGNAARLNDCTRSSNRGSRPSCAALCGDGGVHMLLLVERQIHMDKDRVNGKADG